MLVPRTSEERGNAMEEEAKTHIVAPPGRHRCIRQVDREHDDGLCDLRAAVEADPEQVVVLAEPRGVVPQHVAHEEERQHRRGHEVGRLVHGEDGPAVQDHGHVAALLDVPVRPVPVHDVRDADQGRSNQERVVDPVVRAAVGEEVLRAEDAPEYGQGVVALGLEGEPRVRVHLAGEGLLADLVDDEPHDAVVDEGAEEGTVDLAPEHLLLRDLHVESKLVV